MGSDKSRRVGFSIGEQEVVDAAVNKRDSGAAKDSVSAGQQPKRCRGAQEDQRSKLFVECLSRSSQQRTQQDDRNFVGQRFSVKVLARHSVESLRLIGGQPVRK